MAGVGEKLKDELSIPILVYHRVHGDDDPTTPPVRPDEYCGHVNRSEFERQINYFAGQGFRTITHQDLIHWYYDAKNLPPKPVLIDFDDNRLNIYQNAFPILKERGYVATVFVITRLATGEPLFGPKDFPAMTWKEIGELSQAGWAIGSHTRSHIQLTDLARQSNGDQRIREELVGAKEDIRRHLGVEAGCFAYPVGAWDERIEGMVKQVYRTARLWQEKGPWQYNTRATRPHRLVGVNISAKMSFDEFKSGLERVRNA